MEVKLNVNLQDFSSNFQNSLFLVIKLRTPISFIIGMSTSLLGLKNQFAFGNAEICYFPFFHWRLEAKKFRFSRSCFTILNIYEDQNDYQLKQKNGLDFSNFAPTSIINSNSYTLCYAAAAEAKDETFSSSQFFLPCETLEVCAA